MKKTAYAWMTDFVGYLPMPERGEREASRRGRLQRRDDRAGRPLRRASATPRSSSATPTTSSPRRSATGLPGIREWTEAHFDFAGYVTGFDPSALGDRAEVRRELGYHDDEPVCIVSVGGSAVGTDLLRRVARAFPAARRSIDGLRMIIVTGPRIDPSELPSIDGRRVPQLRARALPAPGRRGRRRRPGRAHDHHGAHRLQGARSSTSRCATTSSRTSTSGPASTATAPGRTSPTRTSPRTTWPPCWPTRSASRSTTCR